MGDMMGDMMAPTFEVRSPAAVSKARTRVQLTDTESAAASAIAAREGLSRGQWITKLVRMTIANVAEPAPEEMRQLVHATAEMRALVVALSRLARALERATAGEADEAPSTDELAALVAQLGTRLDIHAETVAHSLRASHERWAINPVRRGQ